MLFTDALETWIDSQRWWDNGLKDGHSARQHLEDGAVLLARHVSMEYLVGHAMDNREDLLSCCLKLLTRIPPKDLPHSCFGLGDERGRVAWFLF